MAAASYSRVMGANDRVALGLIGSGRQGNAHWKLALAHPDAAPIAVADVYEKSLENGLVNAGGKATGYKDSRRLLEYRVTGKLYFHLPDARISIEPAGVTGLSGAKPESQKGVKPLPPDDWHDLTVSCHAGRKAVHADGVRQWDRPPGLSTNSAVIPALQLTGAPDAHLEIRVLALLSKEPH